MPAEGLQRRLWLSVAIVPFVPLTIIVINRTHAPAVEFAQFRQILFLDPALRVRVEKFRLPVMRDAIIGVARFGNQVRDDFRQRLFETLRVNRVTIRPVKQASDDVRQPRHQRLFERPVFRELIRERNRQNAPKPPVRTVLTVNQRVCADNHFAVNRIIERQPAFPLNQASFFSGVRLNQRRRAVAHERGRIAPDHQPFANK